MAVDAKSSGQQAGTLLRKLHSGYEKRRSLLGGAAREKLDAHLLKVLRTLGELQDTEVQEATSGAPPKAVATAMCAALWSHPHLTIFFGDARSSSAGVSETPPTPEPDFPIIFEPSKVKEALGLDDWQLDDLREEVDRRVGTMLKQERALDWLWNHFKVEEDNGEALFRVLFPAARNVDLQGLCRRGAQLYVVVHQVPVPPRSTLYIVWPDPRAGAAFEQLGLFGGRFVDGALRRRLGRGIGADDGEIIQLLDSMVTVVPKKRGSRFLAHDLWRVRGFAGVTGLGRAYSDAVELIAPLPLDGIRYAELFRAEGATLELVDANANFDRLALPRVTTVMRLIYAELVAGLHDLDGEANSPIDPGLDDLEIYDVSGQLSRALNPIVRWTADSDTEKAVAEHFAVPKAEARRALDALSEAWLKQLERGWCAPPATGQPRSVASICTYHLIQVHRTLRRLMLRGADSRWDHRDLMMLFSGFYFSEAQVQNLWSSGLSRVGAPIEETFSVWVWGSWQRLLDTTDEDSETFSGAFTFEEF